MSGARPSTLTLAALLCAAMPASGQVATNPPTSSADYLAPATTLTSMVVTVNLPPSTTFRCALDAAPLAECTSPVTYSGLPDGRHVFRMVPVAAGVPGLEEALHWRIDTTGPTGLGIVAPAIGATVTSADVVLSWTAVEEASRGIDLLGAGFEYRLDGAPPSVLRPDWGNITAPSNRSVQIQGVADGEHTWTIRAFDALGNSSETVSGRFTVAAPPTALIPALAGPVLSSRALVLDASGSLDNGPGALRHDWDLDGDGAYETSTGTVPRIARRFAVGRYRIGLRITDAGGLSDVTGATITVVPAPPRGRVGISIAGGAMYVRSRDVALRLVWPAFSRSAVISPDGGFRPARTVALRPAVRWRLPGGPDGPRTVYARFTGGGAPDRVVQDDVILDRVPPRIARIPTGATWTLRADDAMSGVGEIQVRTGRRTGPWLAFGSRAAARALPGADGVRARDLAGNASPWLRLP